MIDLWLCWCVGIILILIGVLTAIYFISLQMRRGATSLTVLSTSDTLALTAIGVLFITNGLNTSHFLTDQEFHNETLVRSEKQDVNEVITEECDFRKILVGYGIFLAPFLNAFLSMLVHAVECYHDIKGKGEAKSVSQRKPSSSTENATNTGRKQRSASAEIPRRTSLGTENVNLRRPTLISELQLIKQHLTEIAIEPASSSSSNDLDISKPSSSKTVQDIDVFQVSNLPKQNVSLTKLENQRSPTSPHHTTPKLEIWKLSRADLKSWRRLGVSLLVQWLLPITAILLLYTSNMEEHSFNIDSRIEETTCYIDNIASTLRISSECIDQLRQENFIKSVLSKPMLIHDNSQIINRYSLQQRNKTGDVDRITSMIIKQIYSHVDDFNKTRRLKPKRLTKLARPSRVSNTTRHKIRRKMHERHNITGSRVVTIPHYRTLVKPPYDINLTRGPASVKDQETVKKKAVAGGNVDGSAGYYDELPADYEEPEDQGEEENGSEGISGEAMSEEVTVKPSPPSKTNTNKEESDKLTYDEVVSEEGQEPEEEEDTSQSSSQPKVTTQKPSTQATTTEAEEAEEVEEVEEVPDEEGSEEMNTSPSQPFVNSSPRPTRPSVDSPRPTRPSVETLPTRPSVDQEFNIPSTATLDLFGTLPIGFAKNNTLGGFLVQNIEEFNNIKICVKKCSIATNFMKGYLFAVLFLGYFIPIIVAVVIYIVIVKNVNTVVSEQISRTMDSENKEDTDTCKDMSCLAEIVKQFILISIVMWTPTFLEILLRTWFCVRSPRWVTMVLFALGQVHGIVRNFYNMKLVKVNTKGQVYRGLWSGIMRRNDSAVCPSLEKNQARLLGNLKEKFFMKNEDGLFGKVLPKS